MRQTSRSSFWVIVSAILAGCGGGSSDGTKNSTPPPPVNAVAVSPTAATLDVFGRQQFNASVNGQSSNAVTWQVNGIAGGSQQFGFISAAGLYFAPAAVPAKSDGNGGSTTEGVTISIKAVSTSNPSASGSATVTLLAINQNAQNGPAELGTSGSNAHDSITSGNKITCCGGTLGSLIQRGGTQFILSANHVLARSDGAAIGDAIVQPGLIDTSTCTPNSATTVANLSQFFNLQNGSAPKIDAAIAQVAAGKVDTAGNILLLGDHTDANGVPVPGAPQAGFGLAESGSLIGREVAKSGRSTGLTCAAIGSVNALTSVDYAPNCDGSGNTFTVTYANQIEVLGGSFSAAGDSGSLIVTQDRAEPVALLYAGSDTDTVGNPVSDVLNFFTSEGKTPSFVGGGAHSVIGCTLPSKPAASSLSVAANAVKSEAIRKATAVRDAHAPELLAHPEVQALGMGMSYDNPEEAAILLFVTKGQPRTDIPAQVDGVRTRMIEADLFSRRGAVSLEDSATLERSVAPPQLAYRISEAEYERARVVHAAHAREQMNQPGVQGVAITSSVDSPGEAALMIFLVRGVAHGPIPAVIEGLRTRVRESSRFKAGFGEASARRACSLAVVRTTLADRVNKLGLQIH
ncbi:MAG: hypothetical protein AUG89_13805 [Acidobacteria bacterium 13_1_20CM_4_56_7]|nr:MAG: hypothetical protein AUG89_13805 [Acidobacteria bacterium 13_1_20CM_4_56_7]